MVQAIRAHDRGRRARLALRLLLARPDALGLLGRPAARGTRAAQHRRAHARAVQSLVRRAGRAYKHGIAWALEHRAIMIAIAVGTFVVAIVLQVAVRRVRLRSGERPQRDQHRRRAAAGREPAVHDATGRASGRARTVAQGGRCTRTRRSAARRAPAGWTTGASTSSSSRRRSATISQEQLAKELRREFASVGGVTAYTYASGFGGNQKQVQLQLTGADNTVLNQLAEQIADRVRRVPGRRTSGSRRAARSRSSRPDRPRRRRPARREHRADRAGAAPRVCRGRRGHVGGSVRRIPVRAGAARAGVARERRRRLAHSPGAADRRHGRAGDRSR